MRVLSKAIGGVIQRVVANDSGKEGKMDVREKRDNVLAKRRRRHVALEIRKTSDVGLRPSAARHPRLLKLEIETLRLYTMGEGRVRCLISLKPN